MRIDITNAIKGEWIGVMRVGQSNVRLAAKPTPRAAIVSISSAMLAGSDIKFVIVPLAGSSFAPKRNTVGVTGVSASKLGTLKTKVAISAANGFWPHCI